MSLVDKVKDWFTQKREARLYNRLAKRESIDGLTSYVRFISENDLSFPIENPDFQKVILNVPYWKLNLEDLRGILKPVEHNLFENADSRPYQAWQAWIESYRTLKISPCHVEAAKSLKKASLGGHLDRLNKADFNFILEAFLDELSEVYPSFPKDKMREFPLLLFQFLLDYKINAAFLSKGQLLDWISKNLHGLFRHRVIQLGKVGALQDYIDYIQEVDASVPMMDSELRKKLFLFRIWPKRGDYPRLLLALLEGYLFNNILTSEPIEWRRWFYALQGMKESIDLSNPIKAKALLDAQRAGKLSQMSKEFYTHLMTHYQSELGKLLFEGSSDNWQEQLSILLEYTAIAHVIGPNSDSVDIIKRWTSNRPLRPRALDHLSDEEAFKAPISGVGSPHKASLSIYRNQFSEPTNLVLAGTTADTTLNSRIFSNMFAAGLISEREPTFVLSGGSVISFNPNSGSGFDEEQRTVFTPSIGIVGGTNFSGAIPSIGMTAQEVVSVISTEFQKYESKTGLAKLIQWRIDDPLNLESKILNTFYSQDNELHVIKGNGLSTGRTEASWALPLLHKNDAGRIEPIKIPIPLRLLGKQQLFTLITNARYAYLIQLIADAKEREEFARKIYEQQQRFVKRWRRLNEAQKLEECRIQPFVTISQKIDFNLGITVKVDPPEKQQKRIYEDFTRPGLMKSALEQAEKYKSVQKKLRKVNEPGGRADALTLKVLIDSGIRQSNLPIDFPNFQTKYAEWVDLCSSQIWNLIENWVIKRGLGSHVLAADNILFNSSIDEAAQYLYIEPWALVNMSDFVILIDNKKGLMETYPGTLTPSMEELIEPDETAGVSDPKSLHHAFSQWMNETFSMSNSWKKEQPQLEEEILNDSDIGHLVKFELAKRTLFAGKFREAIVAFGALRRLDLAPVYFWGAIACQCKSLEAMDYHLRNGANTPEEKANLLINKSLNILGKKPGNNQLDDFMDFLSRSDLDYVLSDRDVINQFVRSPQIPIDNQAKGWLNQLNSNNPAYLTQILLSPADILKTETRILGISALMREKIDRAILALSSLELFELAELMKDISSSISFSAGYSHSLKESFEPIYKKIRSMKYRTSQHEEKIEEFLSSIK